MHEKILAEEKINASNRSKLKGLYEESIKSAENEEELLRRALTKIYQERDSPMFKNYSLLSLRF
jgi:hypothetical protein